MRPRRRSGSLSRPDTAPSGSPRRAAGRPAQLRGDGEGAGQQQRVDQGGHEPDQIHSVQALDEQAGPADQGVVDRVVLARRRPGADDRVTRCHRFDAPGRQRHPRFEADVDFVVGVVDRHAVVADRLLARHLSSCGINPLTPLISPRAVAAALIQVGIRHPVRRARHGVPSDQAVQSTNKMQNAEMKILCGRTAGQDDHKVGFARVSRDSASLSKSGRKQHAIGDHQERRQTDDEQARRCRRPRLRPRAPIRYAFHARCPCPACARQSSLVATPCARLSGGRARRRDGALNLLAQITASGHTGNASTWPAAPCMIVSMRVSTAGDSAMSNALTFSSISCGRRVPDNATATRLLPARSLLRSWPGSRWAIRCAPRRACKRYRPSSDRGRPGACCRSPRPTCVPPASRVPDTSRRTPRGYKRRL